MARRRGEGRSVVSGLKRPVVPGLLLMAAYYAVFGGEYSVFELREARVDVVEEQATLEQARTGIDSLRVELDRLEHDPLDFALYSTCPRALCQLSQVLTVSGRVQMIGIIQFVVRENAEPIRLCGFELCTILSVLTSQAFLLASQPEVLEPAGPAALTGIAKRVNVLMSIAQPIFEADAQFESAVSELNKVGLGDLQQPVDGQQGRDRRLSYTHGADLFRLDERDRNRARNQSR